jgi:hypothetical protein
MNDLYRTMNPNHADSKDDKEVAIAATTTTKFKGVCGKCKKQGHMARDCKLKKKDEAGPKNLRPSRHIVVENTSTTNAGIFPRTLKIDLRIGCQRRQQNPLTLQQMWIPRLNYF